MALALGTAPLAYLLSSVRTADGVFAVSADQRIIHWGASAQQILGHEADAVLHQPCYEVIGGRDAINFRFCRRNCPIMRNARKGRPTRDYDLLVRSRDNVPVWLNMTILLIHDKERRTTSVVHLFRDVTRRRRLEEQARRALIALREVISEEESLAAPAQDPSPPPTPELSRREREVLRLVVLGMSTEEIGESLGISPVTARNHLTNLQLKLGAKNRLQAVLYASQHHLI